MARMMQAMLFRHAHACTRAHLAGPHAVHAGEVLVDHPRAAGRLAAKLFLRPQRSPVARDICGPGARCRGGCCGRAVSPHVHTRTTTKTRVSIHIPAHVRYASALGVVYRKMADESEGEEARHRKPQRQARPAPT